MDRVHSSTLIKSVAKIFSAFLIAILLFSLFDPLIKTEAASVLSITPITWNIIGLDSNNVTVGPNQFPVGARVCNAAGASDASNVNVALVWDSANSYINLASSSLTTITIPSLPANSCYDAYFNVEITRNSAAYDTTRKYHIVATDSLGVTARTPYNRELYVEHLVSQARNAVSGISVNGTPIALGGSFSLVVGQTYTITLSGSTSTNGYNQLESFLNLPNSVYQILSVTSSYSAASGGFTSPIDKLYADACNWISDTTNLNYRSCQTDGKAGGTVTNTYQVKVLSATSSAGTISTLLYDFSGSSFHYNSDYPVSVRYVNTVDPATLTISKSFSPATITAGGTSTLSFTLTNPTGATISGVSFTDTFPSGMVVASPSGAITSGCGSPTLSATSGSGSISFSGGTLAANSICNIRVNVTVSSTGTYNNSTGNLKFIDNGNTIDTGNSASATLTASSVITPTATPTTCTTSQMVKWSFPSTTLAYDTGSKASDVSTATASFYAGTYSGGGSSSISTTQGYPTASGGSGPNSWDTIGYYKGNVTFNNGVNVSSGNSAYLKFAIDTSYYKNINFTFHASRANNGPTDLYIYYGNSGTAPETYKTLYSNKLVTSGSWYSVSTDFLSTETNTNGVTYFYVYGYNAQNTGAGTDLLVDDITFSGCKASPKVPTITKSFSASSSPVNGTATLTFTLSNPNASLMTGVHFTDPLPDGLVVASTPAATTTCSGATFAPAAGSMTLDFSGGSIPAASGDPLVSGSCTASVNVKITKSGLITNTSGYISATDAGTNSGSTGYATASITGVLLPPSISKSFGPTSILTNANSTLTFTITNPNPNDTLSGIAFSDTYPSGVVNGNLTTNPVTNGCGGSTAATTGGNSISLSSGSLAGGASCSITVPVTAASAGTYTNTSGTVSSTNGGTGNTASAGLTVTAPNAKLSLLKQISTNSSGPWSANLNVAPSTQVYYRFIVENIGDISLNSITVVDPGVNTSGCSFTSPLAAGDYTTCVVGPLTSSSSAGKYSNTAYAEGTYTPGSTPVVVDSQNSTANYYIYPDLTAAISDDVSGNVQVNTPFTWTTTISNIGSVGATFADGQTIFSQTLPASGANYGTPTLGTFSGVTNSGNISCSITSGLLTCKALGSSVTIDASGNFNISLGVTPLSQITLNSTVTVDPASLITESNENNNTATDSVKTLADPSKSNPSITTTASPTTGTAGTALTAGDTATISGGLTPTGSILFTLYSDSSCTVPVSGMSGSGSISSGSASWSSSWTPSAAGTYYWQAFYAGDVNNNGYTTTCGETNEQIVIAKASPTISTVASPATTVVGNAVTAGDSATISGGAGPSGDVTFTLYSDATCSTPVSGMSGSGTVSSGAASWSKSWTPASTGTYYWKASYAGDANNNSLVTTCGDTNEQIVVQAKGTPVITTNASPTTGTIGSSITVGDTATLTGGITPSGNVTFTLFSDAACSVPVAGISGSGTISGGSASWSTSWTPAAAGTYYWQAQYPGDANNDGYTTTCGAANEQIVIGKASPTITTSASPATGTAGTTLTVGDTATLSGGSSPTGSVIFTLYSDAACSTTVSGMSGSGTISSGSASWSKSWTPTAAGTYYWLASYAGDTNNNAYTTTCGATNEQIVIGKASPTITTSASPATGAVGVTLTAGDTATLSGGSSPTGSVAFTLYSDAACSTAVSGMSGSGTLSGGSASWSKSWTPSTPGAYYWLASYAGDTNNNSFTTACGDSNETLTIQNKATPTLTTAASPAVGTIGTTLTAGDTATLTGGISPSGTVTFTLYSDSVCSVPVSGMSGSGTVSGGAASWSKSWTPASVGTFYWKAEYSGDASNESVTTTCNAANEEIVIGKATPAISTTASPTSGTIDVLVNAGDTASITGGYSPTGDVTFTLYSDVTCSTAVSGMSGSGTISGGSASWSKNWTPSTAGTYYWKALYGGDTNNNSSATTCGDASEQIVINKASPTMTTTASPTTGTASTSMTTGDSATLTGGITPTGSVTFTLYSDATCSTAVSGMSGSGTVSGSAASWSKSWTPPTAGTYYWKAVYGGDDHNNSYTTACGGTNEEVVVAALPGTPAMTIVKSANPISYTSAGDEIHYNYLVTNSGNISLSNISVVDDKVTVSCPFSSLGVSEYMNCIASYTITSSDMLLTGITNNVQATANEISTPVTDQTTISRQDPTGLGTVNGVVYLDGNSDGSYQSGETLITQSITIQLVDLSGNVLSTTQTVSGAYTFTGVSVGNYRVVKWINPTGYLPTSPDTVDVTVSAATPAEADFGHYGIATGTYRLNGHVWNDVNKDTVWDTGEAAIPGILVTLYRSDKTIAGSKYTDTSGYFEFTGLAAGLYTLVETDGTTYPDSSTVNTKTVVAGNQTVNFGDYSPSSGCTSFSDPMVDVQTGKYPETVASGENYFLQFQVTNVGDQTSGNVDVSTQIPSFFDVNSVNIYFKQDINHPAAADSYTTVLSGNSLVIHFAQLTPGNTYNILISVIGNTLVSGNSATFNVYLQSFSSSCGDLSTNNLSSILLIPVTGGGGSGSKTTLPGQAPETGFMPGGETTLPLQPLDLNYQTYSDMWLEIASLGVKMPILGVPLANDHWDTTWLGKNAGWLSGTAFPGMNGNTVMVGHVYLSNGLPGPMVDLEKLKWGDRIVIHDGGELMVYVVYSVSILNPDNRTIMQHETDPVLTLVTCKGYNESTGHYNKRVVVKANLLEVDSPN